MDQFFRALYGNSVSHNHRLNLFFLPSRRSTFYTAIDIAVKAAEKSMENVYFGIGLRGPEATGRGSKGDVRLSPGVWADIDYAGEGHKKENLPGTRDEALALVAEAPLQPTIVVHSGHGLQVYWLFDEPWALETEADREAAENLCEGWHNLLLGISQKHKWGIDATWDLARVFRVPGTLNRKADEPVPVEVLSGDGPRHSVAALQKAIGPVGDNSIGSALTTPETSKERPSVAEKLTLTPDRSPPPKKLLALMENETRFRLSYEHNRPDLTDQSSSGYDMSLAAFAVAGGWNDQQIADLIIASRRENGSDPKKYLRKDYIRNTISKARASNTRETAALNLERVLEGDREAEGEDEDEGEGQPTAQQSDAPLLKKGAILAGLGEALGIPIEGWIQHGTENARYTLITSGQRVAMGTAANVLNFNSFRPRIFEATGKLLPRLKSKDWDNVCRGLAEVAEIIENCEVTLAYQVGEWVSAYLEDGPVLADDRWKFAAVQKEPFLRNGHIHITANRLRYHMQMIQFRKMTTVDLCNALREGGWVRESISVWADGGSVCRSYWKLEFDRTTSVGEVVGRSLDRSGTDNNNAETAANKT